jgi:ferrous iron transport protein B
LALVLCVVDVTRLEKSLYFALQVIRECGAAGKSVRILANMIDVLERHAIDIDLDALGTAIGAPVLGISARSGGGLDRLEEAMPPACVSPPAGAAER